MTTTSYRTSTLLAVEGVSLIAEDGRQILRDITVSVDDLHRDGCVTGQVVAFLGPSGVGKSTLLRILAGLQQPTFGRVMIENRKPVVQGAVGMVMQDSPLFRRMTVLENLKTAARAHGSTVNAESRALEMLTKFGMLDAAGKYPAQLSGGMRQRMAIAQQLICSDHYLLMDEPFASLDPLNVKRVCKLITEVANQDELNTIIVATHDIRAALSVADTLWMMGREPGKPGATILETYDLIARDLCWREDVEQEPAYLETWREILKRFDTL